MAHSLFKASMASLFLICLAFSTKGQQLQPQVKQLLDTTISIMQKNAANSSQVDWDKARKEAYSRASHAQSPADLGSSIRYLYQQLDDYHGVFFYKDSVFRWTKYSIEVNDALKKAFSQRIGVRTAMLENSWGYLNIPFMPASSIEQMNTLAGSLQDSLCQLLQHNPQGLIIDLRLNGGGAVHPMLGGISCLLEEGLISSMVFPAAPTESFYLKEGQLKNDSLTFVHRVSPCQPANRLMPVVVLTSPATGSSAEGIIIALKGRPNTVFIGEATSGYITVNNGFPITEEAGMNLAVGFGADKYGVLYKTSIAPDIEVKDGDDFEKLERDQKVLTAMQWLESQK